LKLFGCLRLCKVISATVPKIFIEFFAHFFLFTRLGLPTMMQRNTGHKKVGMDESLPQAKNVFQLHVAFSAFL